MKPSAALLYLHRQPDRLPPAVVHFNYDELDETCQCRLCHDYRESLARVNQCRRDTRGHVADCPCWLCVSKRDALVERRMMTNKRDIYSELSYLTSGHKFGPNFLGWVYRRIMDEKFKSPEWWANTAGGITLRNWMAEWQGQHLPQHLWAVSGLY